MNLNLKVFFLFWPSNFERVRALVGADVGVSDIGGARVLFLVGAEVGVSEIGGARVLFLLLSQL